MEYTGSHSTQIAKAFVARYFGVVVIRSTERPTHPAASSSKDMDGPQPYLALKDLTMNFSYPCVIDIKMGTQTFEPSATLEKKLRENIKYCHQKNIGFRITGFKMFDVNRRSFYSVGKTFGRSLEPFQIIEGLKLFFYNGQSYRRDVLVSCVDQLERLLVWFRSQNKLHFYCSSILITYDGLHHQFSRSRSLASPSAPRAREAADELVQIKMIDFAHTISSTETESLRSIDEGYILGLVNLLGFLRLILEEVDSGEAYLGAPAHLSAILEKAISFSSS